MDPYALLADSLLLDLETTPDGRLLKVGAVRGERAFSRAGRFYVNEALAALDGFSTGARFVLGHNLLDHDLPILRALLPSLGLLQLPVIDTLFLSPLAYPENPYHRLVKDYKLVREAVNDPVADARLAGRVFVEQWQAFAERGARLPDWLDLLRYAFSGAEMGRDGLPATGFLSVWKGLGARLPDDPMAVLCALFDGRCCSNRWPDAVKPLLHEPRQRPVLAYVLTWLLVAGGNSVLPPWVRRRFPGTLETLRRLRDEDCGHPGCRYCRSTHDPEGQLRRWFGFDAYRPTPAAADGGSLQRAIVAHGLAERPLLGILPTGGGKSLCYQIPALARYLRRAALTVVISPLQALMKDQVDGLNRRVGADLSGALYGLLTPPERGELLQRVRLGDIALLYVSPEQFRNRSFRQTLTSREIGAWVFDEAHCLSKWGHDFRPDYLYCARFIREFTRSEELPLAPVCAYTATAKLDVIDEICRHFQTELGLTLALFEGGVERDNLRFEVQSVSRAEKLARIDAVLRERLGESPGAAVVYCFSRRATEDTAGFLATQGWASAAFHAGLTPLNKRAVQDAFIAGATRVICATNAFGMGIDKEDVRLVIHADAPGSLENYLQEAGRAGRDRAPAECVLLYAREDIENQFRLGALTELSRRDIAGLLRALRRLQQKRGADQPVIVTAGELLRDEDIDLDFEADDRNTDTRLRAAVAWLERAGFVERDENRTQVFQGKPLVRSREEAQSRLDRLELSAATRARWQAVLEALMQADPDRGLSSDELEQLPAFKTEPGAPPVKVLRLLDDMQRAGLLGFGLQLTAFLRPKGAGGARAADRHFERVCDIERAMIECLREAAPDADASRESWPLELRMLNQRLLDEGHPSDPELLRKLLKGLAQDGRGLAGDKGSLLLRHTGKDRLDVRLQRSWRALAETAELRRAVAVVVLRLLLARVPEGASGEVLVEFSLNDLSAALAGDALLKAQVRDPLAAVERALLFLHEQQVIALQKGLAVFRQAMTIRVLPEAKGRRYGMGDYAPLAEHYKERVFQVHVMDEYARLALARITQALALVGAYFTLDRKTFLKRFFSGRAEELKLPTAPESFREIVDALDNPVQQAIVAAPKERNLLVLAGPGSGKSRVVVHRVAYLLRVRRVPPRAILVLCYNRNAAVDLRRRLFGLVGAEARGVMVQTFHGLALRLTGHALDGRGWTAVDFTQLLREAGALLRGERELTGLEADELRDRLLAGYRFILVDEYQDIDAEQYELVSAIVGRTLDDPDRQLAILAVGDDDQNIYAFRGANVEFIRRFEGDYRAETHHLVENYRCSAHIVAAANRLIARNRDRMKTGQPIRLDRARRATAPGGAWQLRDPLAHGKVQVLHVADAAVQAAVVTAELQRLGGLDPTLAWRDCAVLARTRAELMPVRAALEHVGIPVRWAVERESLPSPFRVREIAELLAELRGHRFALVEPASFAGRLPPALPWTAGLVGVLDDLTLAADGPMPACQVLDALTEWLGDSRRGVATGEGICLTTAHGAKGLEFEHVLILGDWRARGESDAEAERRLYYVAMTRARAGLCLCQRQDAAHPHLGALRGDFRIDRDAPAAVPIAPTVLSRCFEYVTLEDIFIGHAGRRPSSDPIHKALGAAQPGDPVRLVARGDALSIVDAAGRPLARLSRAGRNRWQPRLPAIERATLVALIRREREEEEPPYRQRLRAERWLVPVVEVVLGPASRSWPRVRDSEVQVVRLKS